MLALRSLSYFAVRRTSWLVPGLTGLLLAALFAQPSRVSAELLTASDLANTNFYQVDTVSGAVTSYPSLGSRKPTGNPDSLIYYPSNGPLTFLQNALIYTDYSGNKLRLYDPTKGSDPILFDFNTINSGAAHPVDIALSNNGRTIYVSEQNTGYLDKITLPTTAGTQGTYVNLLSTGNGANGVVVTPDGRIFLGAGNSIEQYDSNLNLIATQSMPASIDGMVYDAVHNFLFATSQGSDGVYRLNLNNGFGSLTPTFRSLVSSSTPATSPNPDGIIFDGVNTLYIAARYTGSNISPAGGRVLTLSSSNFATATIGTLPGNNAIPGLDDLAPFPGTPGGQAVPEPTSFVLCGLGALLAAGGYGWRRRKVNASPERSGEQAG